MAPLTDPDLLSAYREALNENQRFAGYVTWKPVAKQWLDRHIPGVTPKYVTDLMWKHVEEGREIDQVPERREEWSHFQYHYDLRIDIEERKIYIETVLFSEDDDPTIQIVSIHDA